MKLKNHYIVNSIQAFIYFPIQSLYYTPAGRYINAWMHSLKKSVKPEIVNRYDLWVLRHKIGGVKVFVNNVCLVVFIRICVLHTALLHLITPLDIIYKHFNSS
jgi:hypothetical protein